MITSPAGERTDRSETGTPKVLACRLRTYAASWGYSEPSAVPMYSSHGHSSVAEGDRESHSGVSEMGEKEMVGWFCSHVASPRTIASMMSWHPTNLVTCRKAATDSSGNLGRIFSQKSVDMTYWMPEPSPRSDVESAGDVHRYAFFISSLRSSPPDVTLCTVELDGRKGT